MKSVLGIGNALTDILAVFPDDSMLREYHLPPGSMQPKIEACMEFVRSCGGTALITSLEKAADALAGKTGTIITK